MPIKKLSRYGEQYFPDDLKQWIMSNSLINIDSFESPDWLLSNTEAQILKDYQGNGVSDYHISVLEINDGGEENIKIDPEKSFSAVDMYLYGIENIDSAKVVGNFLTEDGNIRTDSATVACKSFNIGHKFPIHLSINEKATEVKLEYEIKNNNKSLSSLRSTIKTTALSRMTHRDFVSRDNPRIGMPVPVQNKRAGTPIVIISVDTLRYDVREQMEPVLSALGENAVVPSEPRTNGHWTPPSHATMFTGVHPGEHKYVGVGEASEHPIHPELITIPQLLSEKKYKCSGLASHARILPEGGFGRGFYRYYSQNMTNWLDRKNDAHTAVNRLLRWIEQDRQSDKHSDRLFYFLHIFDPHQPYIPDHPTAALDDFDLDAINKFGNAKFERQSSDSSGKKNELNDEVINTIRSHYAASVKYTARQIRRLIRGLKSYNLFDNALVIVTGDHGELFGEHSTYKHQSVHYTNIRPFMIVKPPANTDWKVPDTPSTIDLLPTVATAVGAEVPDQCQGTPWQKMSRERSFRITERIRPDTYSIAVEHEGVMGIYTYPEQYPERPGQAELEEGPINKEFYLIENLHEGRFDQCENTIDDSIKKTLRTETEKFISTEPILNRNHHRSVQASEETEDQLRHLGYK
jgi:hypothetical protein